MSTLTRSRNDRWIAGVCGGLAQRVGIPSSLMRLIFVVSCILPGPQFLLYLLLWVVIPEDNSV